MIFIKIPSSFGFDFIILSFIGCIFTLSQIWSSMFVFYLYHKWSSQFVFSLCLLVLRDPPTWNSLPTPLSALPDFNPDSFVILVIMFFFKLFIFICSVVVFVLSVEQLNSLAPRTKPPTGFGVNFAANFILTMPTNTKSSRLSSSSTL